MFWASVLGALTLLTQCTTPTFRHTCIGLLSEIALHCQNKYPPWVHDTSVIPNKNPSFASISADSEKPQQMTFESLVENDQASEVSSGISHAVTAFLDPRIPNIRVVQESILCSGNLK